MEASVVEFLYENLKLQIKHKMEIYKSAHKDFAELEGDLEMLNSILKDGYHRKPEKEEESFKKWERSVRDVIDEVEDMIDTWLTKAAKPKGTSIMKKVFKIRGIVSLGEAVRKIRVHKVRPLLKSTEADSAHQHNDTADIPDTTAEGEDAVAASPIRQKKSRNIVGFEKETGELIKFLDEDSNELLISSIMGMAGMGKTTLARKIFEHPTIKNKFPIRIWVTIYNVLNMKNVLLTILRKFTPNAQEESQEAMVTKVREQLKHGKFLIVMDDIWTLDAWNAIKAILPMVNSTGRVLVTTRHTDVAERASSKDRDHYLRFLTHDESWQLLQYEVYGKLDVVPKELMGVGKVIATDCDGLPLSIVVLGGILAEKKGIASVKKEWEEISRSVKPYLVDGDKNNLLSSIMALSYKKLPYELRNCFLYLGVFPEDADIPVNKLIRLWVAEGFVERNSRGLSLEQAAYENLKDLINRNLVVVTKATIAGEPKLCRIHDSVREICKTQASFGNLNLFQEINHEGGGSESHYNIDKCRRICIHSYVLDFFKKKQKLPEARSFLCFHESAMNLEATDMQSVMDGFSLLRVYDAKNIKFPKFPKKLMKLLQLRYLTLVMDQCVSLPENISDLWNLQTLTVDISSHTLEMKADIWKMTQLRHFKTKSSIILRKDGQGEGGGDNLQTLSRLSSESCTDEVFTRAKNLVTLGIQGDLNKISSVSCFKILDQLNKLKLVNEGTDAAGKGPLHQLPDPQSFPPNLKILVLCSTYLDRSKMEVLSRLGSLEVLKLKKNAIRGERWEADYVGGFPHLEHLHIEMETELVYWSAAGDHPFPKLKFLVLNNCEKLIEVPPVLGKSLEVLSLKRATKEAVMCANKIVEEQMKLEREVKLNIG